MILCYPPNDHFQGTWEEITQWLLAQPEIQLDIETNVTSFWCTKKIRLIQFGDMTGERQVVLDYTELNEEQKQFLKDYLYSESHLKVIHNASFEYIVLRMHGMILRKLYCTAVGEKILMGGIETLNYSLSELCNKYLGVTLDKTLQTSFSDVTDWSKAQLEYAANDVVYLAAIREKQLKRLQDENLEMVCKLEMRALPAFSWCTVNGVYIDADKWRENVELAGPVVDEALKELNEWLIQDSRLMAKAVEHGFLKTEDTVNFNLNAPKQKAYLLRLVFPDIPGTTQVILQKYLRDNPDLAFEKQVLLVSLLGKDSAPFVQYLLTHFREELIQKGMLLPKGTVTINWNSIPQALSVLQGVEPKLKALSEEALSSTTHPVFQSLSHYKDALKLLTSYGEEFIMKFTEPDGKVRTNYNPIVSTGRSSSNRPNMQNIPAKESIGNRYRNAFIYTSGWKFVDSDYTGQELALIAFASKDDVWYKAIERGEDLHSVTASMVYGAEWEKYSEDGCSFKLKRQKCKCKGHKTLRNAVKTINFGLAYGMSKFKLSSTLKFTVKEAEATIDRYFRTFPQIKYTLEAFGQFGVRNGYTMTLAPFFRRRYFPEWGKFRQYIDLHLAGIEFNAGLGRIERQAKNHPIQGSGSDIIKMAMVVIYEYIHTHNLQDEIHLLLNVHDQLTTACVPEKAEWWKDELDRLMCEAAKVVIPTGLLKADTNISDFWTK